MSGQDRITARELRFERRLPASVELVWAYLVDPELRKMWFMGGSTGQSAGEDIEMVMDHRHLSDVEVATPEAYAPYVGSRWAEKILRIEPPHLLSFTWSGGDAGEVTIELHPEGSGTRLVLTHSGLRGPSDAISFGGGWLSHLAVLRHRLAGERIADFWAIHAAAEARVKESIEAV